jgi:hypothetical protein
VFSGTGKDMMVVVVVVVVVMVVEFMQQRTTVTSEVYCETLENCIGPFKQKVWNADIRCSAAP